MKKLFLNVALCTVIGMGGYIVGVNSHPDRDEPPSISLQEEEARCDDIRRRKNCVYSKMEEAFSRDFPQYDNYKWATTLNTPGDTEYASESISRNLLYMAVKFTYSGIPVSSDMNGYAPLAEYGPNELLREAAEKGKAAKQEIEQLCR